MGRKLTYGALACAAFMSGGYLLLAWRDRGIAGARVAQTESVISMAGSRPSASDRGVSGAERPSLVQIVREQRLSGTDDMRFNFGSKLRDVTAALKLSPSERERLTSLYVGCMLAKAAIETDLVQVVDDRASELILSIPAYPAEGAELKNEFGKILAELFPGSRADEIDDYLGRYFDERALGFGRTAQVLRVTRTPDGAYRVVRTTTVMPGETLSGFQETSPIKTMESTALLTLEQIRTGEYMAIAGKLAGSAMNKGGP